MTGLLKTIATLPEQTGLFSDGAATITAGQIRQTALDIAARLAGKPRVFLHTASASAFVAGLLAAWRAGLTVQCPAHVQPRYLDEIGADDGALLTDRDGGIAMSSTGAPAFADVPDGELDLIFYTSGVTGTPKQVRKSTAQLDREAGVLEQLWGKQAGRTYATVSHQHIYGLLFRVFWPVLSGRVSEDRPAEYWESLGGRLVPGTTLISSPAHLTRLSPALAGSRPSLIFSSGAPLPFAAAQASREQLGSLPIEVLGSTETGGIAWRQQDSADAFWTPLPGVDIDIDSEGLLNVNSPFVSDGPVATGDLAEVVGGRLRLKGRGDRIVKIDGKRVSLARVEEALAALPLVTAAAAIDLPQRKGALGAIVELSDEGRAALAEQGAFRLSRSLRAALAGGLEPGERPKHWRFCPIPLDMQGKRVQSLLRASFAIPDVTMRDENRAEIAVELRPEMIWFQGHFPGQPVLPGIAQVHMAAQWAEEIWNWRPTGAHLSQLKFRRILRPGDSLRLVLTRDVVRRRLQFAYHLKDIVASEGIIGGGG